MSEGLDARLIASFCVAIVLDVLLPVAGVLWARRRLGVDWKVLWVGALAAGHVEGAGAGHARRAR